ncbi:hypothetical protein [Pseudomonas typographi]|uniref:hypothetical protein n=1 Tax=Pseudomonas typographi TaxID=2715964 RepID=UPI001686F5E9|nr:hypothetical protein [Pseudomonas typographi]MBD1590284.1 hypothetical protein [Pseudomonas typographi]
MSEINWSKAPEGATHFDPVDQNFLRVLDYALLLYNSSRGWTVPIYTYGTTISECKRALIKRPQWDSQGLPPVGEHVHIYDPEGVLMYGAGEDGEVIAYIEDTAVVRMSYGLGCFTAKHLRTAEQIAKEEREKVICDIARATGLRARDGVVEIATALYEAGYRKQEPAQ